MDKVMVVGAGTMGAGIAQVFAQAGYSVVLCDVEDKFVARGMDIIRKNLERLAKKGKITTPIEEIVSQIKGTTSLDDGSDADLVIEAVPEVLDLKKEIFKKLDSVCKPSTILSSNTSSLSVSELGSVTQRPEKVVGMHFFNPVPVMQLVEIVRTPATSDDTLTYVKEITEKIGKSPVVVNEWPGFIVNRILIPMINEAIYLLMEGAATAEDIDKSMKLGANHPMGPLALADLIGLDVCLAIMETLYKEFGDDKYRPCPLLRKMVRAGYLGRKTNQGFYKY
ncbi:MAG: 3-hydroxybutyryl-CoA dehydrogenase [Thermoanaerobacterales bacterium 50_218]|nr:MAG: 3-hydroxybutyryl-CoA dehydrogenase [Thermoanaerobacterales bacterium 50_218]HAA90179.1 3-hydroxybutyryl-CoA dehydrogenase [Peptococcaceae bacterium]